MGKPWSKAQLTKYKATCKAKRLAREAGGGQVQTVGKKHYVVKVALDAAAVRAALIYLKHARRNMMAALHDGALDELDGAHLYALLALNTLQGKE